MIGYWCIRRNKPFDFQFKARIPDAVQDVPGQALLRFPTGMFQALLTGPDATTVVVEGAGTFTNWMPIATNILPPAVAGPCPEPRGALENLYH